MFVINVINRPSTNFKGSNFTYISIHGLIRIWNEKHCVCESIKIAIVQYDSIYESIPHNCWEKDIRSFVLGKKNLYIISPYSSFLCNCQRNSEIPVIHISVRCTSRESIPWKTAYSNPPVEIARLAIKTNVSYIYIYVGGQFLGKFLVQ